MLTSSLLRALKRISIVSFCGLLLLGLAGCDSKSGNNNNPPKQPPAPTQPKNIVKVELRPESSGEFQRISTYTPDGAHLIELQIDYRDGNTEKQFFRNDGTTSKKQKFYQSSRPLKLEKETEYAADGTTVVMERTFRVQGPLDAEKKFNADGSTETKRYRLDGKRLHSLENRDSAGNATATYWRADGSLWAKSKTLGTAGYYSQPIEITYYGANGNVAQVRTILSNKMEIQVNRADGTKLYVQTWSGYSSPYYRSFTLDSLKEYETDGTTLSRELKFSYSTRISEAHSYTKGVKSSSRYYRWDGTLEREETLDAAGKVTATKNHDASEGITEPVDSGWKVEPAWEDPTSSDIRNFQ